MKEMFENRFSNLHAIAMHRYPKRYGIDSERVFLRKGNLALHG